MDVHITHFQRIYFHTSLHKPLCRTTLPVLRRQLSCSLLKDNLLSHLKFKTKVIFKKTDVKLVTTMYGCSEVLKALYRCTHTDLTVLHQSSSNMLGWIWKLLSVYVHVVYLELCHHQVWSNWWKSPLSPVRPSLSRLRGNGGRMGACVLI